MLSVGDDCFSRIEFQGSDGPLGSMEPVAITAAGHRRVTTRCGPRPVPALTLPRWWRNGLNSTPHIIRNRVLPHNTKHSLKCCMGSSTLFHPVDKLCSVTPHQVLK